MEALFVPWDHLPEVPQGAQEALQVIKTIHAELFAPQHKECVVGSGGKEVGYLAHGTATDYMFHVMKVPLPFTFEIFGDLKANYDDCFKMFNPIDEAQMKETLSVWLAAILRLMDLAPRHSLVATELMIESGATTGWGHGEIIEVRKPLTERYGWLIKIGAAVALMALLAFMALKSTRPVASPLPVSSPAAFISKSGFERV